MINGIIQIIGKRISGRVGRWTRFDNHLALACIGDICWIERLELFYIDDRSSKSRRLNLNTQANRCAPHQPR